MENLADIRNRLEAPAARRGLACLLASWIICTSVLLTSSLAWGLPANQSIKELYHTAWVARDGVPSTINDMAQGADGYLWLGGDIGLFRFDGVHFEKFVPAEGPQLPGTAVFSLDPASDGSIWIGWQLRGASRLKDGKVTNYGLDSGLPEATVNGVMRDGKGRVWAATAVGLYRLDGSRWRFGRSRDGLYRWTISPRLYR